MENTGLPSMDPQAKKSRGKHPPTTKSSKRLGRNKTPPPPSPLCASPASEAADLAVAIVHNPADSHASPPASVKYEIYEENEFDMNDDMTKSEPSQLHEGPTEKEVSDAATPDSGRVTARRGKKKKAAALSPNATVTKRGRAKRAQCWQHYSVVKAISKRDRKKVEKAKCKYCGRLFAYTPGGQTSSLNRHLLKCKPYISTQGRLLSQGMLHYDPEKPGSSLTVAPVQYDHEATRKIIAKMIIVHAYSFRMVEHTWFNVLMNHMNPSYKFIGRKTIRNECMKVYESEKELLKIKLKDVESISLTCDLWTSNQNLCYMALVAHYIDSDWAMQCHVLNFIELDPPHTGNVIAQAVFECIVDWKIEDKIISITMDNASSNDVAARNLMAKFVARKTKGFVPSYFHVRCCAHIVNLVVNDGLQPLQPLVSNLRETVKYMKKSPSRMYKFLEVCKSMNLTIGAGLCLDVSTRWSSTYKMFDCCIPYRAAFTEYGQTDYNYKWEPSYQDWTLYSKMQPILKAFADVTKVLSGSVYPTSNVFYPYIMSVKIALVEACNSGDRDMKKMAEAMMAKFDKYWEEKNNVMVIATVLDPRFPVVSKMGRKFLTIPATSVSSESTFSTGGRVLDDYRSALHPAMVEALVCASNFIRGSKNDNKPLVIKQLDDDDDVELVPFPDPVEEIS
ncbi:hypothetical protein ACQ4PT_046569 [Festuca glaucescens]